MRFGRPQSGIFAVLSAIVLLYLVVWAFGSSKVLVVTQEENRAKVVAAFPFRKTLSFEFRWTHSIEKTPVIETLEARDTGAISVLSVKYKSHGMGLPDDASCMGRFRVVDGTFCIDDMNICFRTGIKGLWVPVVHPFILVVGPRSLNLTERVGGKLLDIKVMSILGYLLARLGHI